MSLSRYVPSKTETKGLAMKLKSAVSLVVLAMAITGCNRSINSIAPSSNAPQRLPSAPVEQVQSDQLPAPVENQQVAAAPTAPETPSVAEPAVTPPPPPPPTSGEPVTREAVSGSWNVESDNPDCRMILAFTKWSGGYRAATKRCNSSELASVSAWDVKGQQVVLMDGGGNTIARLYNSGGNRYDGSTNSGKPVSFTRPG